MSNRFTDAENSRHAAVMLLLNVIILNTSHNWYVAGFALLLGGLNAASLVYYICKDAR